MERPEGAVSDQAPNLFSSSLEIDPGYEGEHYFFQVNASVTTPVRTRFDVELLYFKMDRNDIPRKVYETVVRQETTGQLSFRVAVLKRPLWAGWYRLRITYAADRQPRTITDELPVKEGEVQVTTDWKYGTEEMRNRQVQGAEERARRDYLDLMEMIRSVRKYMKENRRSEPTSEIKKWFEQTRKKLQEIRNSNLRRPRYDGRTAEYNFLENRTAYFLRHDLNRTEKILDRAQQLIQLENPDQEQTEEYRERLREVQESASRTIALLGIVPPIPEQGRERLERTLGELEGQFSSLIELLQTERSNGAYPREEIRGKVTEILRGLAIAGSDIPDLPGFLYKRIQAIGRDMTRIIQGTDQEGERLSRKDIQELHERFQETKQMAESYMEELKND